MTTTVVTFPPKPLLRGWSHLVAFGVAALAGYILTVRNSGSPGIAAAIVYSSCLAALFGLSALYHRPNWAPRARAFMRRLDHSGIVLMIAGTITPVSLVLPSPKMLTLLGLAWGGALLGFLRTLFWPNAPKPLIALSYLMLGWTPVMLGAPLVRGLEPGELAFIAGGGLLYTLGAVCYALKRPSLWPRVFGYHEVFHLLVIGAAVCHFVAVTSVLDRLRR